MSCSELAPYLEPTPGPEAEAAAAHAAACAECRADEAADVLAGRALAARADAGDAGPLRPDLRAALVAAAAERGAAGKPSAKAPPAPAPPRPVPDLEVRLSCTYCHEALDRAGAVYCADCLAPHDRGCFLGHGACSAPGCGGTRVVEPREVRPPRPRARAWDLAGAVVFVGATAAVAGWLATGFEPRTPRRTEARPPGGPTSASPPPPAEPAPRSVRAGLDAAPRGAGSRAASWPDLEPVGEPLRFEVPGVRPHVLPVVVGDRAWLATGAALVEVDLLDGAVRTIASPSGGGRAAALAQPTGAAVDDSRLAAPFLDALRPERRFRGLPVREPRTLGRLAVYDLVAQEWLWSHAAEGALSGELTEWSFPARPSFASASVIAAGVTVGEATGVVRHGVAAFAADTGEALWTAEVSRVPGAANRFGAVRDPVCGPVTIDAERNLVYAAAGGRVVALDGPTGVVMWEASYDRAEPEAPGELEAPRAAPHRPVAPILVGDALVVLPADGERVSGYAVADGELLWTAAAGADRAAFAVGADGERVVVASMTEVRAHDPTTGALLWRAPLRGAVALGLGWLAGDQAWVPMGDGTIARLDLETGQPQGNFPFGWGGDLTVGDGWLAGPGEGLLAAVPVERR